MPRDGCQYSKPPWWAGLLVSMFVSSVAGAAPPRSELSARTLVTDQVQQAIDKGLGWLASQQEEDGAFGTGSGYARNIAVTSLSGLAFLSSGSTSGRGRYALSIDRTVACVLAAAKPNGYINVQKSESHGPMYGHGFATLFLAEVYGMSHRKEVRTKLQKAVQLIVNTQNDDGGWRYEPVPKDADLSVTVCQMMALRAARNGGLYVPKETVDRCIAYIKQCQEPDGGFRYQLKGKHDSQFPRSAAGIVGLYSAGVYKGPEIERGRDYLMRFLPDAMSQRRQSHFFYGHYYAAQAMWQSGDTYWLKWYPAICDELLRQQQPDGHWPDPAIGSAYGTAMACIILQIPNDYLPIFQR